LGGKRNSDKYSVAHAGKYRSKYGAASGNNNSRRLGVIGLIAFLLIVIIGALSGCDNVKHVEAMEGYTPINEEFVEEAGLVDIEGFYAGTGVLNGITHVRFVAEKDGKQTATIDVTKRFYNIVDTDTASAEDKQMEGKVKAYKRTYQKDNDVKTHYYYVLYSSKNKVKDIGELSTD
jgi:hypothetical protein